VASGSCPSKLSVRSQRRSPIDISGRYGLGVVNFVTLSNGEVVEQCQPLKKLLPKLAKLQRRMARKNKFSKNWRKAKARITKFHSKIANIRKDFLHQSSKDISKNHAVVFIEDLQVKNMSASSKGTKAKPGKRVAQKSGLNRAILDASPFELRRQLEYKCPECQHTAAENRKRQAKFVCVECGFRAHADYVGAVNIKEAGFALLACHLGPSARERNPLRSRRGGCQSTRNSNSCLPP
jgi:putative transposase